MYSLGKINAKDKNDNYQFRKKYRKKKQNPGPGTY